MLKKFVSLSVLSAMLISAVSCGNATTSLYRSRNSLGDQITTNMNKVMNDAERNVSTNRMVTNNTYGTKIYTNKISNGYANNYSKLNSDYNYNGVERMSTARNVTGANLVGSMTPVQKTNTMTSMPVKTNTMTTMPTRTNVVTQNTALDVTTPVRKSNTMTTIPAKNTTVTTAKKANTMTTVPVKNNTVTTVKKANTMTTLPVKSNLTANTNTTTVPRITTSLNTAYNTPYRTVNGNVVTTDTKSRFMSNSVDRVLNTANAAVNNVTAPNNTTLATDTTITSTTNANTAYPSGMSGAVAGSDVSPMIIA